ncbi:MAG: hypothetical protein R2788_01350 [Saprospiraceae bacterium]
MPASANTSNYTNTTTSVSGIASGFPVTGNAAQDDLLIRTLSLTKAFAGPGGCKRNGRFDIYLK